MSPTARERLIGSILGGAIGDALGAPIEFDSLGTIRRTYGPLGLTAYAPAYGRLGAITDDTQMTLFTADGLLGSESMDVEDLVASIRRSYLAWLRTQDPSFTSSDISESWLTDQVVLYSERSPGNTCLTALYGGGHGAPNRPPNGSKGCGGVMRVAPVGALPHGWFEIGARAAALTHGHPSGYLSAGVLAHIVGECVHGTSLTDAIDHARTALVPWADHEETLRAIDAGIALAASGDVTPEALETLGGGWVGEEALAIGLCCALVAPDVRAGLLLAVNHSGDSDSTGSITGNLLGAMHGIDSLPTDLLENLEARELIERIANDLALRWPATSTRTEPWERRTW